MTSVPKHFSLMLYSACGLLSGPTLCTWPSIRAQSTVGSFLALVPGDMLCVCSDQMIVSGCIFRMPLVLHMALHVFVRVQFIQFVPGMFTF